MKQAVSPSAEQVKAGSAVYGRGVLAIYDVWVLGIVCPLVWHCSRARMLEQYDRHVGNRHLDLGPGSGFYLDHCTFPTDRPELTLVDLNDEVLRKTAGRLRRYRPAALRRDVLQPLNLGDARFDSVGMNFLLHCIPGGFAHKGAVFDNVVPYVTKGGRIFGSTVLSHGVEHGRLAPAKLTILNATKVMSNREDSLAGLDEALSSRFERYRIEVRGSVAMFEITVN
ncbi:class I SAM-dependent methyltransferase [Actinoplanes rectilineatus]|uniref:class I SAM-dependent methyltransferase n=1 Tax=Actinoplanes rectilineatus TaxID=113571 RepID=UPI000AF8C788|nr:class I SAM-dependent methyltransferase [Actinoplanes rectilineatus]